MRRLVHGLHLEHHGQSLGAITISPGVAVYPQHGEDPETLLRAADKALYQAQTRRPGPGGGGQRE